MLFKPPHIVMIDNGTKTETRRIWKRPHAKRGGEYRAKTKMMSKEYFMIIRATIVYQQRIGDMTEENARNEGGYTLEEYKKVWRDINGKWDDDLYVYVVEFTNVGKGNTPIPDEWRGI